MFYFYRMNFIKSYNKVILWEEDIITILEIEKDLDRKHISVGIDNKGQKDQGLEIIIVVHLEKLVGIIGIKVNQDRFQDLENQVVTSLLF